jgi:glycosyltransferase involved in cell wall biosynthesis
MRPIPEISVVMSVYNGEKYLDEAIESILNQTYTNFEFIIINDGSKDRSLKIIEYYKNKDERIVIISRENKGLIASLNEGIERAKGKYIARMDADDISLPTRFEEQVNYMESNDVVLCGTFIELFGTESKVRKYPVSDSDIRSFFIFRSPFAHPSVMMDAKIVKSIKYNKDFIHAEDYKLWAEFLQHGKAVNIAKVLLKYRVTAEQITSKYGDISVETSKKVRREYINDFFIKNNITQEVPSKILLDDIKALQYISNSSSKSINAIRESYYLSLEKYTFKTFIYFLFSFDYLYYPYSLKDFLRIIRCHIKENREKWL